MDLKEWMLLLGGGTGLAAMIAAIAKYLMDRRRLDYTQRIKEWNMLVARIVKLESDNEDCMATNARLSEEVGGYRAEVRGLKIVIAEMQRQNIKQIARTSAENVAERVESAVAQAIETQPPEKTE